MSRHLKTLVKSFDDNIFASWTLTCKHLMLQELQIQILHVFVTFTREGARMVKHRNKLKPENWDNFDGVFMICVLSVLCADNHCLLSARFLETFPDHVGSAHSNRCGARQGFIRLSAFCRA